MMAIDVNCLVIDPSRNFDRWLIGDVPLEVRHAVAVLEHDVSVAREQHCAIEMLFVCELLHVGAGA
jgi:hypothetical protein